MKCKWGQLISLEYGKPVKDKAKTDGQYSVYGTNGQIGTSDLPPLCNHASFILGRKGAYRGVHYSSTPFSVIDTAFYAENLHPELLNIEWAYYKFLTYDINSMDSGSAIPSTDRYEIYAIEVDLPDYKSQEKTVGILRSFDDKIELNNKINENLERQAQALYKMMFTDNPHSESIQGVLSDIATITMGQSPTGSSYNEAGNGEVFYQGRAEFGIRFPTRRLFTTEPKRMAAANDVLLSVRAPVGDLNVAYEKCCIGRGLSAIHSKDGNSSFLLYTMFALKQQLDVFNGEGTVFGSINKNGLSSLSVDIPCADEIAKFEAAVRPMDNLIRTNYEENCRLQMLRDSLLPRLMHGEIDVEDVNI